MALKEVQKTFVPKTPWENIMENEMNTKTKALGKKLGRKTAQKFREADILRNARKYDSAPNFVGGKPTDAFKMRSAADAIRRKYKK